MRGRIERSGDLGDFVESRLSAGRLTMKVPMGYAAQYPLPFDALEARSRVTAPAVDDLLHFGPSTGFTIIAAFLADRILVPALLAPMTRPWGVEVAKALETEAS